MLITNLEWWEICVSNIPLFFPLNRLNFVILHMELQKSSNSSQFKVRSKMELQILTLGSLINRCNHCTILKQKAVIAALISEIIAAFKVSLAGNKQT